MEPYIYHIHGYINLNEEQIKAVRLLSGCLVGEIPW
jgi:hypothetical protein